jgi:hypothetical protein
MVGWLARIGGMGEWFYVGAGVVACVALWWSCGCSESTAV